MANRMRSDELNIVNTEQVIEEKNIEPIDLFFDEMYLTESEKNERKDLAKALFVIFSAILTIIKANETLKNEHDVAYYKDYVSDNMKSLYRATFGSDKYSSQIDTFADNFINVTMESILTGKKVDYFTSDARATVNAENQSNAVYNQNQFEEAIRTGKEHKTWVTMHDKRVRKSHVEADGQMVELDKPFLVGGYEMLFPLDQSLGAHSKECVNCRCCVVYS